MQIQRMHLTWPWMETFLGCLPANVSSRVLLPQPLREQKRMIMQTDQKQGRPVVILQDNYLHPRDAGAAGSAPLHLSSPGAHDGKHTVGKHIAGDLVEDDLCRAWKVMHSMVQRPWMLYARPPGYPCSIHRIQLED